MNIYFCLYFGLLLHFVGDYLTQNDWLANEKTKAFLPAFLHATIYSLPFLFIVPSLAWLIVFGTHFLIDRYRLAVYWIKLMNWNWQSTNFGFANDKPAFMSIWLMIIIDNTFHVIFNTIAILIHYSICL